MLVLVCKVLIRAISASSQEDIKPTFYGPRNASELTTSLDKVMNTMSIFGARCALLSKCFISEYIQVNFISSRVPTEDGTVGIIRSWIKTEQETTAIPLVEYGLAHAQLPLRDSEVVLNNSFGVSGNLTYSA